MAPRRYLSLTLRRQIAQRAGSRCEYCLSPEAFSLDAFTVDHIIPLARQGTDDIDNLAHSCYNCNNRKQDDLEARDPLDNQLVPIFNPRKDHWKDHFCWSSDLLTIIPVTSTGRATVERLHLNRPGAINIRRALLALGEEHPPLATRE